MSQIDIKSSDSSSSESGPPGIPGIDGLDGQDGEMGPPGVPGSAGATGTIGATGSQGIPGLSGTDGDDGEDGFPGPPGLTGSQGAAGATGSTGVQGPIGPPGLDGESGQDSEVIHPYNHFHHNQSHTHNGADGSGTVTHADIVNPAVDQHGVQYNKILVGCRVYNNAAQIIANNTGTVLTFNTERFDTDTFHSTAVNTSRLTATYTGYYHIFGNVGWATNAVGIRYIGILLNGTAFLVTDNRLPNIISDSSASVSTIYFLTAGDYVELWVYQNSGGNLNSISTAPTYPEFGLEYLGV